MDTCFCMAESLCCPPKTITTLLIGYARSATSLWPYGRNPRGYSVHGILQARILEIAIKVPIPPPGDLLDSESEHVSPALQADSLPLSLCGSLLISYAPIQFSRSVFSDSLWPHWLQHTRPPCPSLTPGVSSNSCPLSRWAIQPSHPLSSPSPPAFNLSQHQGLFKWVSSLNQVAKVLEFQLLAITPIKSKK